MAKKQSQRAKAANQMTKDLGRWDDEGGAPAVPSPLRYDVGGLPETERRLLESLGAALVGAWHDLPTDIQRIIFQRATADKAYDPAELSSRIARFLHDHKGASGAR
ncbi:hypothetical protein [Pseudorhodoplanes sinuspersici]|uniref:Uncharacterized protein n=1 Tax=Pseudorhodoplanes sinuspersici TaxID=1235591 RepID=A0A1W6ZMA5_9HYPH|nr:hypothetical protein [Pseudorhodoplanes sinuspersici]ARP97904.1 hypothetical protein CAK95_01540 [Pseudorhodoplanes sinuspersici]RKE68355.1 hypothetical protein DFP91_4735 [Pseudorhodoplanes sinuspersici]